MPLFSDFDLNPALLTRLNQLGHHEPTPIQSKTIPLILNGRDVMAAAQTGTGKTAAFALPLLHRLMSSEQTVRLQRACAQTSVATMSWLDCVALGLLWLAGEAMAASWCRP